jgi:hypothetical protein
VPDQESTDMISLSGKKYMDQPFALKYRKEKPGENLSCSCKTAGDFVVIGGANSSDDITLDTGSIKTESPKRAVRGDDGPVGDFVDRVRAALDKNAGEAGPSAPAQAGSAKVRVVGPRFFPDPKEGAMLRSPGPGSGR